MNRRSFITSMLAAAVAPMVLNGAGRTWKRTNGLWVLNPEWVNAPYEIFWSSNDRAFDSVLNQFPKTRLNIKGEEVPWFILST